MDVSRLIDIKFSKDGFTDFYALSISLTEEVSRPYKAIITVLTVEPRGIDRIREILGAKAAVTVTQATDKDSFCSRFLSGVITGYRSRGAVYSGSDSAGGAARKSCVCYELTLEPSLAAAGFVRKMRTFRGLSLIDVVKSVGREYGTEFKETFINPPKYYSLKDIVFHQHNESDLDFINRLLISYGIDYYFFHSENSFEPEARLTDSASLEPFSKAVYTGGEKAAQTGGRLECCLSPYAVGNGAVRLTGFQVEETSAFGSGSDCRAEELCRYEYDRSLGNGEKIIERKFMENNLTSYFKSQGSRWDGSGGHAALIPGSRLLISGFSLDDGDKLPCVLTGADLFYEASWPSDMAVPADGSFDESGKPLVQSLRGAVEDDGFEKSGSIRSSANRAAASEFFSADTGGGFLLTAATVCDSESAVSPEGIIKIADESDANVPEMFYALPDGGGERVVVNFVMPLGGAASGLFYFPHTGDRVLIQMSGGRYYLLGYLPSGSRSADVGAGVRDYLLNRTVLRRRFAAGSWSGHEVVHELNMSHENSITENVACFIMSGWMDKVVERVITGDNEGSANIRNKYEKEPVVLNGQSYTSLKKACAAMPGVIDSKNEVLREKEKEYIEACKEYAEAAEGSEAAADAAGKRDHARSAAANAKKELDGANRALMELADKVRVVLGWAEKNGYSVMGLNTTGDLNLRSGRKVNVYSENDLSLVAGGGVKVNTSDDGSIELVSKKSIKLSVGPSSISLTPNGIIILSRKWATATGPFDASICLDSVRGISMQGGAVSMSSLYNTSMGDAFGGLVSVKGGSVSVGGNTVSIATNTGLAALVSLGVAVGESIAQASTIYNDNAKAKAEYFKYALDEAKNLFSSVTGFIKSGKRLKKASTKNDKAEVWATGLIPEILNVIAGIIDTAGLYLYTSDSDFLTKVDKNGVSGQDSLRLAITCAKLSTVLIGMGGLIGKMSMFKATSVGITKGIKIETADQQTLTINDEKAVTAAAGGAAQGNEPEGVDVENHPEDVQNNPDENEQPAGEANAQNDAANGEGQPAGEANAQNDAANGEGQPAGGANAQNDAANGERQPAGGANEQNGAANEGRQPTGGANEQNGAANGEGQPAGGANAQNGAANEGRQPTGEANERNGAANKEGQLANGKNENPVSE